MQFINYFFLAGLISLAIPIIIHLIRSNKTKKIWIGSLRFIEQAMLLNKSRSNWKEILLMIMRLLIITAVVFLFARPFKTDTEQLSSKNNLRLLLIDVSGSMSGKYQNKTMLKTAQDEALKIINDKTFEGKTTIAVFADQVVEVVHPDSIQQTACATDYFNLMSWIQDKIAQTSYQHKEVIIITDCQQSGLNGYANYQFDDQTHFKLIKILPAATHNIGFTGIQASKFVKQKASTIIPVTNSEQTSEASIAWYAHNKSTKGTLAKGIKWTPNKTGWFNATLTLKSKDAYPFDNKYYVRDYVRQFTTINLINGKKSQSRFTSASYFMDKVLNVENNSNHNFRATLYNSYPPQLGTINIFCDANIQSNKINELIYHVKHGGNLIFFLGGNTQIESINNLYKHKLFPAKIAKSNSTKIYPITKWNFKHPMLSRLQNKNSSLTSFVFRDGFKFSGYNKQRVIASLSNGAPAILESKLGEGRIVVFSNPANRDWTDWAISRMFLPVIQETLAYLSTAEANVQYPQTAECNINGHPKPGIFNHGKLIVNASEQEQDVATLTEKDFLAALDLKTENTTIKEEVKKTTDTTEERPHELWHWIALTALLFILLELIVSYALKP